MTNPQTPAQLRAEAAPKGARYACHLLNPDHTIYTTDYHADEIMAEVQGQMWEMCGAGSYRVEKLAVEA